MSFMFRTCLTVPYRTDDVKLRLNWISIAERASGGKYSYILACVLCTVYANAMYTIQSQFVCIIVPTKSSKTVFVVCFSLFLSIPKWLLCCGFCCCFTMIFLFYETNKMNIFTPWSAQRSGKKRTRNIKIDLMYFLNVFHPF